MSYEDARKAQQTSSMSDATAGQTWRPPSHLQAEGQAQEEYSYFYNRIYPLVKAQQIDYAQLAQQIGRKERRIREALLFRLGSGDVLQLFGRRDGFCYVCSCRIRTSQKSKEPICVTCLQSIDQALTHLYPAVNAADDETLADLSPSAAPTSEASPPAIACNDGALGATSGPPPTASLVMVPQPEYDTLLQELEHYRQQYGPLSPASGTAQSSTGGSLRVDPGLLAQRPEAGAAPAPLGSETEALLAILDLDDTDVSLHAPFLPDVQSLLHADTPEPLRHFGFQRLRPKP